MGYIKHNAICVTSFSDTHIEDAHKYAKELFGNLVTEIIKGVINGYKSFFIAPDGSKEGWEHSDYYDELRKQFVKYIKKDPGYFEYVDVAYDEAYDAWIETEKDVN